MTTVNTCELLGKLCEKGMPPKEAEAAVDDLGLVVKDFDAELARLAAFLRVRTKAIGASLGDRACLALAEQAAHARNTPIVHTKAEKTSYTQSRAKYKNCSLACEDSSGCG